MQHFELAKDVMDRRKTLRRNSNRLKNMKKAVWAEFYHLLSNNTNPQHGLCPKGKYSCCKYKKALDSNMAYNYSVFSSSFISYAGNKTYNYLII